MPIYFFNPIGIRPLVEEANNLASNVLAASLLVVHDTSRGGQNDVAELTGRQQLDNPLLEVGQADVVAGRDNTGLVETAVQLNDDLAGAVVIDLLELANVTCVDHKVSQCCDNPEHRKESKDSETTGSRPSQELDISATYRGWVVGAESTVALVIIPKDFAASNPMYPTHPPLSTDHARNFSRTMALHDLQELDNDLGAGSDQDLALAGLLGVVDGVEGIVENRSADHFGGTVGTEILKSDWK